MRSAPWTRAALFALRPMARRAVARVPMPLEIQRMYSGPSLSVYTTGRLLSERTIAHPSTCHRPAAARAGTRARTGMMDRLWTFCARVRQARIWSQHSECPRAGLLLLSLLPLADPHRVSPTRPHLGMAPAPDHAVTRTFCGTPIRNRPFTPLPLFGAEGEQRLLQCLPAQWGRPRNELSEFESASRDARVPSRHSRGHEPWRAHRSSRPASRP